MSYHVMGIEIFQIEATSQPETCHLGPVRESDGYGVSL